MARSRPDLAESHTALLLSSYLQADLPTALIEVTSDQLEKRFLGLPFPIIRSLANFGFIGTTPTELGEALLTFVRHDGLTDVYTWRH